MAKGARSAEQWEVRLLENFPSDRRYLIGVSGGRDSVALLEWLLAKGYTRLIVCHLTVAHDENRRTRDPCLRVSIACDDMPPAFPKGDGTHRPNRPNAGSSAAQ